MTTTTSPEFNQAELQAIAWLAEDYVMHDQESDHFGTVFVKFIMEKAKAAIEPNQRR